MQVQIRNPIAVEVNAADEKGSVSLHFFTAAEHEAAVTLPGNLLPELLQQLQEFVAEEKPQPAKREFERKAPPPKPAEPAPATHPILRALLQA